MICVAAFATWRSVSEICEIGEQGVSIVGSVLLVRLWNRGIRLWEFYLVQERGELAPELCLSTDLRTL